MSNSSNRVRIISGSRRGRQLSFTTRPGLRPSGDRVRETLFNWLGRGVEGATCLDLFAGSGALGFEACSRGARSVVLVDNDPIVASTLRTQAVKLDLAAAAVVCADANAYLRGPARTFDIVFLDPPFGGEALSPICERLCRDGWLGNGSLVYLEAAKKSPPPLVPPGLRTLKDKIAGQVRYALAEFSHGERKEE